MKPGQPPKYFERRTFPLSGERKDIDLFRKICAREGISPSDKMNAWIKDYNRIHGQVNPQYCLEEFGVDNPEMKAVPAALETDDKWYRYMHDQTNIEELQELKQKFKKLGNIAERVEREQTEEARTYLRSQTRKQQQPEPAALKALPENLDVGASRRESLHRDWVELARPSHDRKGGEAHRARRHAVIRHILALQELLPEYQKCQEYQEWLESQRQ